MQTCSLKTTLHMGFPLESLDFLPDLQELDSALVDPI